MTEFIAAVVQAAPISFQVSATIDKMRGLAAEATAQGAKLVVFPEAFVSAYPKGLDFGARLGMRSPEGRDDFRLSLVKTPSTGTVPVDIQEIAERIGGSFRRPRAGNGDADRSPLGTRRCFPTCRNLATRWRILFERKMRPVFVVIFGIGFECLP